MQPVDESAKPRRVGGKFADVRRAIGVVADADPVARIADIDAGGVLVVDRHRRHFGFLGDVLVLSAGVELGSMVRRPRANFLAGVARIGVLVMRVAFGHSDLRQDELGE